MNLTDAVLITVINTITCLILPKLLYVFTTKKPHSKVSPAPQREASTSQNQIDSIVDVML